MFRKVLIANRGEIAVRINRALKELGVRSVGVYSDADRTAMHIRLSDEAAHIGPAPSADSYLNVERILEAARRHRVEAIHPGYGFLSENADFAAACEAAGDGFLRPSSGSIPPLGSKTEARKLAIEAGVPVVPGTERGVSRLDEALAIAERIGYPVMLKAAAGGGGKGMRRVEAPGELEAALRDASSEAEHAFKSGEVYLEKYLDHPRHVEIQVLGDRHGNLIHLGERECSIQRRHQKVIEECPSPVMDKWPHLRQQMGEAAVKAARAAGYYNAGTVEFLVDRHGDFYFLEMNTRLQVEHPVTELVTGLDLVHWQLRIAAGERLPFRQEDIRWRGCALECRIYAEDPENQFFPSPGRITRIYRPVGPGIRLDSGAYSGWTVPVDYDPLLAKMAVWAEDRPSAIARMLRALREYSVSGIKTNVSFFRGIFDDQRFRAGDLDTGFIDEYFARKAEHGQMDPDAEVAAALVALLHAGKSDRATGCPSPRSRWLSNGRDHLLR